MTDRLFGFVQFDLPGATGLPDGRYLAREAERERESVLVLETRGAAPRSRRRRRSRSEPAPESPAELPFTRATAVRAHAPLADEAEGERWLQATLDSDDELQLAVSEAIALVNRAIHAARSASADPYLADQSPAAAMAVRIGFGSGEQVAAGRYASAQRVDLREPAGGRRQRREAEIAPQARIAAVLGGREDVDACEALILRARLDLDAGRGREAALQLRVGFEALLAELAGALSDPAHSEDMAVLESRRGEVGEAANAALRGDLDPERERGVRELLEISERVLRRRRLLRGS